MEVQLPVKQIDIIRLKLPQALSNRLSDKVWIVADLPTPFRGHMVSKFRRQEDLSQTAVNIVFFLNSRVQKKNPPGKTFFTLPRSASPSFETISPAAPHSRHTWKPNPNVYIQARRLGPGTRSALHPQASLRKKLGKSRTHHQSVLFFSPPKSP